MSASIRTPEDVINYGLRQMGYALRINNVYEGTEAANAALDVYAQTRDSLIRNGEWEFAERMVVGNLLKQAPYGGYGGTPWSNIYPALPWRYSYTYPSDCLKLRAVKQAPVMLINMDPVYNRFSIENDNGYTPAVKVVLCDIPGANLTYAAQITDPTTWEADFAEALAESVARRIAPGLAGGLEALKAAAALEAAADSAAMSEKG